MPRFLFALSTGEEGRRAGVVMGESFSEALETLTQQVSVSEGDTLEIGVNGFPPARYECVLSMETGIGTWRPAGLMAA
jgi:hypothetical protein